MSDASARPASDTDACLAAAYRKLEDPIHKMRQGAGVLEMIVEDAIGDRSTDLVKTVLGVASLPKGYRVYLMTEEQADALDYMLRHVNDLARELYADYYDGSRSGADIEPATAA